MKRWTIRRTITFPRDDVLDDLRGVALGVPLLPHLLRHHELVGRGRTLTDDPARCPNVPAIGDGVLVAGDDVPRDAPSPAVVGESFFFRLPVALAQSQVSSQVGQTHFPFSNSSHARPGVSCIPGCCLRD